MTLKKMADIYIQSKGIKKQPDVIINLVYYSLLKLRLRQKPSN